MNSQAKAQMTANPKLQACAWNALDEISENEMAAEMAVIVPPSLFDAREDEMAPEDFERVYQWFLS